MSIRRKEKFSKDKSYLAVCVPTEMMLAVIHYIGKTGSGQRVIESGIPKLDSDLISSFYLGLGPEVKDELKKKENCM